MVERNEDDSSEDSSVDNEKDEEFLAMRHALNEGRHRNFLRERATIQASITPVSSNTNNFTSLLTAVNLRYDENNDHYRATDNDITTNNNKTTTDNDSSQPILPNEPNSRATATTSSSSQPPFQHQTLSSIPFHTGSSGCGSNAPVVPPILHRSPRAYHHHHHHHRPEQVLVTIVSATYAPCEGSSSWHTHARHPQNGVEEEANHSKIHTAAAASSTIPWQVRDVTPFVRALLLAQQRRDSSLSSDRANTTSLYDDVDCTVSPDRKRHCKTKSSNNHTERKSHTINTNSKRHGDCDDETHRGDANNNIYDDGIVLEGSSLASSSSSSSILHPQHQQTGPWIRLNAIARGQRRVQFDLFVHNDDDDDDVKNPLPMDATATTHADAVAGIVACSSGSRTSNTNRTSSGGLGHGSRGSMNGIFGDPAPGLSKRLHIHYILAEPQQRNNTNEDDKGVVDSSPTPLVPGTKLQQTRNNPHNHSHLGRRRAQILTRAESHSVSFAEHERVFLRRRWTGSNRKDDDDDDEDGVGTTQNKHAKDIDGLGGSREEILSSANGPAATATSWALGPSVSEVAVPALLPFLTVRDRVQCRLVCLAWRDIVREWGIATTVDDQDRSVSRPFLRGILSHSYASLQRLFLSNTPDLQKEDLHPMIPHLRKLQTLDISRCDHLDDSTLCLLADCVSRTLEVLYVKRLRKVSDIGVIAIARSCLRLKVLDLSYLALTDQSAIEIGSNLINLRAVFMRDNYHVTNKGIDVITQKCTSLEQLTLWGCTRINHLLLGNAPQLHDQPFSTRGNLVLLNLWGCHSLNDDAANALCGMRNLRTLIVSECHLLTDNFAVRDPF